MFVINTNNSKNSSFQLSCHLIFNKTFFLFCQGDDQKIFKTFQNLNNNNNSMPLKHSFEPRETAFEKRYPDPHHHQPHPHPQHHQLPLKSPFDHLQKPIEIVATYDTKSVPMPLASPYGHLNGGHHHHHQPAVVRYGRPMEDDMPIKLVVKPVDRRDLDEDDDEDEVEDEDEEDDDDVDRLLVIAHRENNGVHDMDDSDQGSSERGVDSV